MTELTEFFLHFRVSAGKVKVKLGWKSGQLQK